MDPSTRQIWFIDTDDQPILRMAEGSTIQLNHLNTIETECARFLNQVTESFSIDEVMASLPAGVLTEIAEAGRQLTRAVFLESEELQTVANFLKIHCQATILVQSPRTVLQIPWEMLVIERPNTVDPVEQYFWGYKHVFSRQVLDVTPARRPQSADDLDVAGLLQLANVPQSRAVSRLFFELKHNAALRDYEKPVPFSGDFKKAEMGDIETYLNKLDIAHLACLFITPKYVDKSYLLIDEECFVSADDIRSLDLSRRGPLILFNPLDNGRANARHWLDFVLSLVERGGRSVITSTYPVPDALATKFAKQFYLDLLVNKKNLYTAFQLAKQSTFQACRNPLALSYTIYEPLPPGPFRLSPRSEPSQITWLHISDLHFKPDDPSYTQAKVVLDELVKDVRKLKKKYNLKFSFIVLTGDVAFSGTKPQYTAAASFLDALLEAAGTGKEDLFIVPGNHDVKWNLINKIHASGIVTTLRSREAVDEFLGQPEEVKKMLKKFKGYAKFVDSYLVDASGNKLLPFYDHHLSYTETKIYAGKRVRILGLNSAWMSAYNWKPDEYKKEADDEGNLVLGRRQLRQALNLTGEEQPNLTIALMHHPWSDFKEHVDGREVRDLLLRSCDFVLRGHLHNTDWMDIGMPDGRATVITAGLAFKSKKKTTEYHGYNVVQLDLAAGHGTVYLRCFSGKGAQFWAADTQTYEKAPDGRFPIPLPLSLL